MELTSFIKEIEVEFDELKPGELKANSNFRDLEDWSSMHALIIIALVDSNYDVMISGEELSQIETVQDLFHLVKNKL